MGSSLSAYRNAYKVLKFKTSPEVEEAFDELDSVLVRTKHIIIKNLRKQTAQNIISKINKKDTLEVKANIKDIFSKNPAVAKEVARLLGRRIICKKKS